jgi:hypothetical protein
VRRIVRLRWIGWIRRWCLYRYNDGNGDGGFRTWALHSVGVERLIRIPYILPIVKLILFNTMPLSVFRGSFKLLVECTMAVQARHQELYVGALVRYSAFIDFLRPPHIHTMVLQYCSSICITSPEHTAPKTSLGSKARRPFRSTARIQPLSLS